ncbi:thioesterase [Wenzhouxiangella sp. XN79A]|uniref:YiiD C-terminal domain-containing protein n=1 Tax=Wenzhouxiangella sp. XN79A TaxID=2724193 RepID=UPI00144AF890|nr:YiiD C-terminal domain-containing protein [Wenzhouxiangella sp. XN79A]NKI36097.1 thioesterase [Wenzhouxiangella sp. XN79A]
MPHSDECRWLTDTLTRQIPLGAAMGLAIARLDEAGIELTAPLAPNVNDKGTAFGGAMMSLMTLAGWSLPRLALRRAGLAAELVIGRCEVRFLAPVTQDFRAVCDWPAEDAVAEFLDGVRARGKGRLALAPEIVLAGPDGDAVAARLEARYAGLAMNPGDLPS